jgi:hypothetical protein
MKVGDLVKLKQVKAYQQALKGLTGIVVEVVSASPNDVIGKDICRIFWGHGLFNGGLDVTWKRACDYEVISESR